MTDNRLNKYYSESYLEAYNTPTSFVVNEAIGKGNVAKIWQHGTYIRGLMQSYIAEYDFLADLETMFKPIKVAVASGDWKSAYETIKKRHKGFYNKYKSDIDFWYKEAPVLESLGITNESVLPLEIKRKGIPDISRKEYKALLQKMYSNWRYEFNEFSQDDLNKVKATDTQSIQLLMKDKYNKANEAILKASNKKWNLYTIIWAIDAMLDRNESLDTPEPVSKVSYDEQNNIGNPQARGCSPERQRRNQEASRKHREENRKWREGRANMRNEQEGKEPIMISIGGKEIEAKSVDDVLVKGNTVIVQIGKKEYKHKHENEKEAKEHAENVQEMVNKAKGKPYDAKDGGSDAKQSQTDEAVNRDKELDFAYLNKNAKMKDVGIGYWDIDSKDGKFQIRTKLGGLRGKTTFEVFKNGKKISTEYRINDALILLQDYLQGLGEGIEDIESLPPNVNKYRGKNILLISGNSYFDCLNDKFVTLEDVMHGDYSGYRKVYDKLAPTEQEPPDNDTYSDPQTLAWGTVREDEEDTSEAQDLPKLDDVKQARKMDKSYSGWASIQFRNRDIGTATKPKDMATFYVLNGEGDTWFRTVEGRMRGHGLAIKDIMVRSTDPMDWGGYWNAYKAIMTYEPASSEGSKKQAAVWLIVSPRFSLKSVLDYIKQNKANWTL